MIEEENKVWEAFVRDAKLVLFIFLWTAMAVFVGIQYERQVNPCADIQYIKGKDSIVYVTVTGDTTIHNPKPSRTYAPQLTNIDKSDSAKYEPCDDSIRVYVTNKVDSSGSIQVTDSVQGKLLSQKVTSASVNTTVFRTDTMAITKEIIKHGIIFGPYASINIGEKTSIVAGAVYSKGRTGYMAGYNLQNKYINLGIFYNLRK
jgi:hypothetical protein